MLIKRALVFFVTSGLAMKLARHLHRRYLAQPRTRAGAGQPAARQGQGTRPTAARAPAQR